MEYDPNEMFREDPDETGLTPEFNADLQLAQEAAELEDTQLDETSTPTGEQPEPAPQPEAATAPPEPFDKTKDFSFYEAQGMSRGEWNRRQMATGTDAELPGFVDDPRYSAELAAAVPTSLLDFGVDILNVLPGVNIPKLTKFENETAQAIRQISSVVTPTLLLGAAGKSAGTAANTRVGWSIGQNKFVQFMGDRGVEALSGLVVGAVSSEYEEDNATGTFKESVP